MVKLWLLNTKWNICLSISSEVENPSKMTPAWNVSGSGWSGSVPENWRPGHVEEAVEGAYDSLKTVFQNHVLAILHDHLGMLKVSSCWVLRMLTPFQKQCRVKFSEENSGLTKCFQKHFSQNHTRWNMKSSLGFWNKIGVHVMVALWFAYSQEVLDRTITWKDNGNGALGFGGTTCHTRQQSLGMPLLRSFRSWMPSRKNNDRRWHWVSCFLTTCSCPQVTKSSCCHWLWGVKPFTLQSTPDPPVMISCSRTWRNTCMALSFQVMMMLFHSGLRSKTNTSVFQGFLLCWWDGGSASNWRKTFLRNSEYICALLHLLHG